MAKKKVVEQKEPLVIGKYHTVPDEVTKELVEKITVDAPSEPVAPPTLLKVKSIYNFKDGAFTNDFKELGYKTEWPQNEVREIPVQLYMKLQRRSGNRFSLV